jgi:replication factor C subunit 2/4
MGRRKLGEIEKLERLNSRKELKQTKLSIKPENNGLMLYQINSDVTGVLNKSKRGRKTKIKTNEETTELLDQGLDFFQNITNTVKSKNDKDNNLTVYKNLSINSAQEVLFKASLPWIEKYRPKTINDIILDECLKNKLVNLMNINMLPNIIISGSSGTGKTSTIYCIAKQILGSMYSEALLELNASDNRGLEIINNTIIHFCKKKINGCVSLHEESNNDVKKIIIFDEADNITNKAQNVLANMMEEYGSTTKFCFTCNDSSKIIESIQSRCLILHYRPMNNSNIKKRLEYICNKENVLYDKKGLESIIFISQGDIRQAINNLEATYNSYNSITEENVYKLCYQPHPNTIINLIQKCAIKNFKQSVQKYDELKDQGYCNSDILQTMINVLKLISIDEHIRINFIKILSDVYLNVNEGLDTNLQMYSCISKMINYIRDHQTSKK